MIRNRSNQHKITFTALALLAGNVLAAQTTTPATAQPASSGYNQLAVLLVVMIIALAFVIWGMGRVLTALGRLLLDKSKEASKALPLIMLTGLSLLSQLGFAQDAGAVKAAEPNFGGLSSTSFYLFVTVIGLEILVILFLAFSIRRIYTDLLPQKAKAAKERSKFATWWSGMDKRIFTRAVAVEQEADVLLDHDYDGIKELDNALPPWWKYGFYITIVVAFVYLLNFHVFGIGKNPTEEYNAEMEKARIEKEIYEASNKDKVDENNVPMADAAGLKAGEKLFELNCVACHLKSGGGNVGPNLTDDYWLHKGSLNDIYHTIKVGYPDKGMQSWSNQFTPKEISYLASYIKTLRGTNPPGPKAPQGDLYVEGAAAVKDSASVARPDSVAAVKADSVSVKK
ncbi:MAG TPA: cbb3-type cytochrome c oxidase N-terminal domain-containing protein [Ferruginibacter sp.]|nr:cbb3-type cytochrome c oxidase N-terminal domain-containing protein [Ferruginibacter sp.]